MSSLAVRPGMRRGIVEAPKSKSHFHRLLIADFLAGGRSFLDACKDDPDDIAATKRCLAALAGDEVEPVLDCGESGSTRRFLSPVASALGKRPVFKTALRLAERPQLDYAELNPGNFVLDGGVSSQFVTGLLFALPLLDGDSTISFSTPLESRGYVEMTRQVLFDAGVQTEAGENFYRVPGSQKYSSVKNAAVEGDWSGAAFWYAMNFLGSDVTVLGLEEASVQPDRAVAALLGRFEEAPGGSRVEADVSECPDLFPALAVASAGREGETLFTGTRRLRLKESDRTAAMAGVLEGLGVGTEGGDDFFLVRGRRSPFRACRVRTYSDHRIAMAAAVAAVRADGEIVIDDASCAAKSYPSFFEEFFKMEII